jgi:signal transduction histidine kinase
MPSLPGAQKGHPNQLPLWTWFAPLPIAFIGTVISLKAQVTTGTSLFYFPIPFCLTMIYWWGPRVLPAFYINAAACAGLWGLERIEFWPLYGLPETLFVFLSWLFFVKWFSGKVWLPDTKQIVYFLLIGILLPLAIYKLLLEWIFLISGEVPLKNYWNLVITTGFGDFISTFCVSIPLLYFLTRYMSDRGLSICKVKIDASLTRIVLPKSQWLELIFVVVAVFILNRFLSFSEYWFLNGILSLFVAVRFGFSTTVIMNSYILVITYLVPAARHEDFSSNHFLTPPMLKTQLGTALLYVFSIITGRVVSDMRLTERMLNDQNRDLSKMNSELDRFVYSVSHDISAPLKSILGLVNISKLTDKTGDHRQQFELIETSANKLEHFVSEVLDYSRNKRSEVVVEDVNVKMLAQEVYDNLKFMKGFGEIQLDLTGITTETITTDRRRLQIILQNVFSNAIKFKQHYTESFIRVNTARNNGRLILSVEDNGQGIEPQYLEQIFQMFFRGTDRSHGAGLGLYIAQEAARLVHAEITVESEFGKGSTFKIAFAKF